jgi:hypothetical protein
VRLNFLVCAPSISEKEIAARRRAASTCATRPHNTSACLPPSSRVQLREVLSLYSQVNVKPDYSQGSPSPRDFPPNINVWHFFLTKAPSPYRCLDVMPRANLRLWLFLPLPSRADIIPACSAVTPTFGTNTFASLVVFQLAPRTLLCFDLGVSRVETSCPTILVLRESPARPRTRTLEMGSHPV